MAKLCLVGEPCIAANGVKYEISPRASMELLALIVLRQPAPLTRTEGTELLYHHIEELSGPVAARQQFRIALSKLRRALVSANLADQLQLNGEDLRLTVPWEVDALQPIQAQSLKELRECFQPVIPHWDHERWLWLRNEYADRLSRRFLELFEEQRKLLRAQPELAREFQQLALLGSDLYPLEPGFTRVSISLAEGDGNLDRAATLRAEFASRWKEQYPSEPVPMVDRPAAILTPSSGMQSRRSALASATVLTVVLLVGSLYARVKTSGDRFPGQIEQLPHQQLEIDGTRYVLREYRLPLQDPPILIDTRTKTDGAPYLLLYRMQQAWSTEIDGLSKREPGPRTYDHGGVQFERLSTTTEDWALASDPSVKFSATPDYPRVSMPIHLGGGLFFSQRICGHSFGCHYDCIYLRDGAVYPLSIDGVKPQTVMLQFADATHVYGMYSLGAENGWRYRPFMTDRTTLESKEVGEPAAVGRFSDGTLVCMPKVTREVRGDYVLQDTKEVVLVQADGQRKILHRNAKFAHVVGDVIAIGVDEPSSNDFYSHTEFYDRFGKPIDQLNAIGSKVTHIMCDPTRRHMAFIRFKKESGPRTAFVLSVSPVTSNP